MSKPSAKRRHILADLLAPDLALWFVGTAAGPRSAAVGAYYAKPGNRFWPTLHAIGVTPRPFAPHDYPALLPLGVGLTDLCKTAWGVDSAIPREAFDSAALRRKIARLRPQAIAFTSRTAASLYLNIRVADLPPGKLAREAGKTRPEIFVLPSPSGLATRWWSIEPWRELGAWFADQPRRTYPLPAQPV